MPLQRFSIDVMGQSIYDRAFEAAAREVENLTDPLTAVAEHLRLSVSEQFRTEGEAGLGTRWQALNPDYEAYKEANWGPQPILVRSGEMRAEMTDPRAFTVSPRRLVYEPRSSIAALHQVGAGHLPARPIVVLNEGQRRSIDRIFASWLNAIRRGPWGGSMLAP